MLCSVPGQPWVLQQVRQCVDGLKWLLVSSLGLVVSRPGTHACSALWPPFCFTSIDIKSCPSTIHPFLAFSTTKRFLFWVKSILYWHSEVCLGSNIDWVTWHLVTIFFAVPFAVGVLWWMMQFCKKGFVSYILVHIIGQVWPLISLHLITTNLNN